MVRVFVPTNNDSKLEAVREVVSQLPAAARFELVKVDMKELARHPFHQPFGWKAVYKGAKMRAEVSSHKHGAGYHVGIQSGLIELFSGDKTVFVDQACVYVVFTTPPVSVFAFAATATVAVPDEIAERIKSGLNELGAIIEYYGKRTDKDAVAFFTRGLARRKSFLMDAVRSAFGSLSFNEEFQRRPKKPELKLVE